MPWLGKGTDKENAFGADMSPSVLNTALYAFWSCSYSACPNAPRMVLPMNGSMGVAPIKESLKRKINIDREFINTSVQNITIVVRPIEVKYHARLIIVSIPYWAICDNIILFSEYADNVKFFAKNICPPIDIKDIIGVYPQWEAVNPLINFNDNIQYAFDQAASESGIGTINQMKNPKNIREVL